MDTIAVAQPGETTDNGAGKKQRYFSPEARERIRQAASRPRKHQPDASPTSPLAELIQLSGELDDLDVRRAEIIEKIKALRSEVERLAALVGIPTT